MRNTFCYGVALSGIFCLWSIGAPEFVPIQEKAQGQSLAGSNLLNDSLYSNPAGSTFTRVYSIDGTYSLPKSFAVSVLDTQTSSVGGSLGFFRKNHTDGIDPTQGLKVSLGGRVSDSVGVGVAGKMVWGPTQTDVVNSGVSRLTDVDTGVLVNFSSMQFGWTVRNLMGGNEALDLEREWTVGGRINYNQLLFLSAAVTSPWGYLSPSQYGFGAEYISPYYFSLKGGYRIEPSNSPSLTFWTLGASFISPKMSVHYALELPNQTDTEMEHLIGVTLIL